MPEGPDGRFTVWIPTQSPYGLRATLAAALGLPEESVRVICTDSGGGFGIKGHAYPEDLILAAAARRLGRPLKWAESRREHFLMGSPDRGQRHHARLGVDREGRIVAVETRFARDHGADMPLGEVITRNTINHLPGPYRVPHSASPGRTSSPTRSRAGPIAGSGRPEAVFVMERLLDRAARRLGLDPAEIRRRNLVRPGEMPYRTGLVYRDGVPVTYDPADYPAAFERLLEAFGYAEWRKRSVERRGGARPIGVGLACYVQGTGVGPFEGADVRVDGAGSVTVYIGVSSQGQAHETTMAQIAAAELGVEPDRVTVVAADTSVLPYGMGTGGSRVAANSGPAVARSSREVADKARRVAAEMLECAPADVVLAAGRVHVAGLPAARAGAGRGRARGGAQQDPRARGAAGAAGVRLLRPRVGDLRLRRPGLRGGGGRRHGRGARAPVRRRARLRARHQSHGRGGPAPRRHRPGASAPRSPRSSSTTPTGQLLTGSFMDYAIPAAADLPALETLVLSFPSTRNDLGIKGVGESGIIPPPAAIANAVEDALSDRGAEIGAVPLTRARVWEALRR